MTCRLDHMGNKSKADGMNNILSRFVFIPFPVVTFKVPLSLTQAPSSGVSAVHLILAVTLENM